MEIVQIINDGSLGQNQWGELISFEEDGDQAHVLQDILVAPIEANPAPQYYFVESDGSLLTLVDSSNFTILASEDDDEIPSHKLDHMYAKKPREPGTELAKPARRRSKKKELIKSHYFVQEMMYEPPPKINIIRGRHAMTSPGYSRPKILTSPQKMSNTLSSTNILSSSRFTGLNNFPNLSKHTKRDDVSEAVIFEDYDEYNAPSPGAVVTVCDGVELDPVVVTARALKPKKVAYHIPSGQSPSSIENRNSSLDSIGEPDDDSELFLDFPMEEEEEVDSTIDVDFSEISTNSANGIDMIRAAPVAYFHPSNENDDTDFNSVSESSLGANERHLGSSAHIIHQTVFGDNNFSDVKECVSKDGSPEGIIVDALSVNSAERQSYSECVSEGTVEAVSEVKKIGQSIVLVPTRRSTRPVKAPSRLDDIDEGSSVKRRRR